MIAWNLLLFTVCVLASMRDVKRLQTILCVYAVQTLHALLFTHNSDAIIYFGSAGLFDLITIMVLVSLPRSSMAVSLQYINLASLAVNALGFALYELGIHATYYNTACKTLLGIQALIMVIGGGNNGRDTARHSWRGMVRSPAGDGPQHHPTREAR